MEASVSHGLHGFPNAQLIDHNGRNRTARGVAPELGRARDERALSIELGCSGAQPIVTKIEFPGLTVSSQRVSGRFVACELHSRFQHTASFDAEVLLLGTCGRGWHWQNFLSDGASTEERPSGHKDRNQHQIFSIFRAHDSLSFLHSLPPRPSLFTENGLGIGAAVMSMSVGD